MIKLKYRRRRFFFMSRKNDDEKSRKRNVISELIELYDIKSAEDIQDAIR